VVANYINYDNSFFLGQLEVFYMLQHKSLMLVNSHITLIFFIRTRGSFLLKI